MLVVNTKLAHDPLMDALRIGDNKANAEAALFYIDHVSESMFYTWTLALTLFDRGQKLISDLDGLVPGKHQKMFTSSIPLQFFYAKSNRLMLVEQ